MGASHHNPEEQGFLKRFLSQTDGTAKREYPKGRLGADDEGAVAFMVAADPNTKRILIDFGKPVHSLGMTAHEANGLVNLLLQKILELGEPATVAIGDQKITRLERLINEEEERLRGSCYSSPGTIPPPEPKS